MPNKYGFRGWPGPPRPLVLYDRGDEKWGVAGGWSQGYATGGSVSRNAGSLQLNSPATNSIGPGWATVTAIDTTRFSKMWITRRITDSTNAFGFALVSSRGAHWTAGAGYYHLNPNGADPSEVSMSCDVSNANGLFYAMVAATGDDFSQGGGTILIYKVWLE